MDFGKLFAYGSLVEIDYRTWSAKRSIPSTVLGLEDDVYFYSDTRSLLGKDTLKVLMNVNRILEDCLEEYTFPFFLFKCRFLPHSQLIAFTAKMEKITRIFKNRKEYLLDNYEALKLRVRPDFLKQAHQAYVRHKKLANEPKSEKTFINEFLQTIANMYPSHEDLKNKMHLQYYLFQVQYPDLSHIELPSGQQHIYEQINEIRISSNQLIDQSVHKFVEGVVKSARKTFVDKMMYLHDTIKAGTTFSVKSIRTMRASIARFRSINFAVDTKMIERIHEFEVRFLNRFKPEEIRSNRYLKSNMLTDLYILASTANKQEEINDVVVSFKKTLGVN